VPRPYTVCHGVQLSGNVQIGQGSIIGEEAWLAGNLTIGEWVLIGRRALISGSVNQVEIASYCLLAPNVLVSDLNHGYKNILIPIVLQGPTTSNVLIEENCWLGIGSVVMASVGRGSVIGANAVVTNDVPPWSVAVGIPAKVIKMFNPQTQTWEVTSHGGAERIQREREKHGLMDRDSFRKALQKTDISSGFPLWIGGRP